MCAVFLDFHLATQKWECNSFVWFLQTVYNLYSNLFTISVCAVFAFSPFIVHVSVLLNHYELELSGLADCHWLVHCWHWREELPNRAPAVDAGDTEAGVAPDQNIHWICVNQLWRTIFTMLFYTTDREASGRMGV